MDNFKPSYKTPPAATNPTPGAKPAMPAQQPVKGQNPGGQNWQKPAHKKTG